MEHSDRQVPYNDFVRSFACGDTGIVAFCGVCFFFIHLQDACIKQKFRFVLVTYRVTLGCIIFEINIWVKHLIQNKERAQ